MNKKCLVFGGILPAKYSKIPRVKTLKLLKIQEM